jgi:hypothetical protein
MKSIGLPYMQLFRDPVALRERMHALVVRHAGRDSGSEHQSQEFQATFRRYSDAPVAVDCEDFEVWIWKPLYGYVRTDCGKRSQ